MSDEPTPAQTTVAHINSKILIGEVDDHLESIISSIKMRRQALSKRLGESMEPGDTVRFSINIRPKYLAGTQAKVVRVNKTTATVTPLQPQGRFTGGPIRCPLSLLDAA